MGRHNSPKADIRIPVSPAVGLSPTATLIVLSIDTILTSHPLIAVLYVDALDPSTSWELLRCTTGIGFLLPSTNCFNNLIMLITLFFIIVNYPNAGALS